MLDKNDLKQIEKIVKTSVKEVVREEIEAESENKWGEIRSEMKLYRMQLESRLDEISDKLKNLQIKVTKVQKILSDFIDHFDKRLTNQEKRIKRLETN